MISVLLDFGVLVCCVQFLRIFSRSLVQSHFIFI